ncbi:DUF5691 domain-containing protein [Amycolatopsis sp. FDAARGOS 1241]|uniref:DUF5691 domain-containing protein n=1 Tax=Amycolatopsis sp. FDAARGOS 1241 TaxID=2778070 RepID=UPI00194F0FCF|nr:DUF5691 domain-containing protein [Amycolatopsis sp. FDAARGOS 1241]QRP49019.1 hypothetical protein I6J71_15180 [Amycolatopsis sp. FDAARGOS 1241]
MKAWEDLVGTALLGTRRRALDPSGLPDAVRAVARGPGDQADAVLTTAALLTNYRRAGRQPLTGIRREEPAKPDARPFVPPLARERLARLVHTNRPELLEEWLQTAARRGFRVAPEQIPVLADAARARVALRAPLAELAGPVGAWLGERNSDWAFLVAVADDAGDDAWQYGTPAQRQAWLERALAKEPAAAREALTATWRSEPADLRATFLTLLGGHLTPDDERFLDAALGDRAAAVRDTAVRLLGALPGTGFGERMAARLRQCVTVRQRSRRAGVLVFTPPGADETLVRDGVRVPHGPGQDTARLRAIVAATPLAFWAEFGTPADLVGLLVEGAPLAVIRESWATAAIRQRDEAWAQALVEAEPGSRGTAALIGVLPPAKQAATVAKLARGLKIEALTRLILDLPQPWPEELGRVLLDWVAAQQDHRLVAHAAALIAKAVPPACLRHRLTAIPHPGEAAPWRRGVAETLTFRREMHEELS